MTTCRAARKKQFDDLLLLQNKTPLKQQQSGTLGQGNRQAKTQREREEGGGVGPTLLCCMSDLECSSLSLFLSLSVQLPSFLFPPAWSLRLFPEQGIGIESRGCWGPMHVQWVPVQTQ